MRALFDVNVLIALFQPDHIHHTRVHQWWETNQHQGWASCPITENGFVRIISQPKYPAPQTVLTAINLLNMAKVATDHEFWPDSLSILDQNSFAFTAASRHDQIADSFLLALATKNDGCVVTLDQNIKAKHVMGATQKHLVSL